jgi:hypothetical protein
MVRPLYRGVTGIFPGWRDSWLVVAQRPSAWQAPQLNEREIARVRAIVLGRVHTPTPE